MSELTDLQKRILNTNNAEGIRKAVEAGLLDRTPEVNAKIAYRCKWDNPAMWEHSKWFKATYAGVAARGTRVFFQRVVTPDDDITYRVISAASKWCDMFLEKEAKLYLTSVREKGLLVEAEDQEACTSKYVELVNQ